MLSAIQVAISVITVVLIITLAIAEYNLAWIIVCLISIEALFTVAILAVISREIGFPTPYFKQAKTFLEFSVPLVPNVLLFWVITSSDRYFIAHFTDLSQVAIYNVYYNLANIMQFFYTPISVILFPILAKFWDRNEMSRVRSYTEYSKKLFLLLAIPGSAGLFILCQPVLVILTTPEYLVGGALVLVISAGIILQGIYMINMYIIFVAGKTRWLPLIILVAAAANVGINMILIPRIGIIGAAIASLSSYIIIAGIVSIWAMHLLNYKIDFKFLAKVVLATLLMALFLSFINISGALSIVLSTIAGVIIYAIALFLLRTFSREEVRLVREILAGLNLRVWMKEFAIESKQLPDHEQSKVQERQDDKKPGE